MLRLGLGHCQGEGTTRGEASRTLKLYICSVWKPPSAEALIFFENEKAAYPESAVLMDKMILGAKNASKEEEQDNAGRENGATDQPAEEETSDAAS